MTNATIRTFLVPLGASLITSRAAAAWPGPSPNEPFEGRIAMRVMTAQSAQQPVTLEVKGGRARVDVLMPKALSDKPETGELPLSASWRDAGGTTTFDEHVVSVRRQEVADSDFEPPPGYKRVDLPLSAFGAFLPTTT